MLFKPRIHGGVVVLVAASAMAGCAKSESTESTDSQSATVSDVQLVNAMCPIKNVQATVEATVQWNGKTIGFCCAHCIAQREGLTDVRREAKLSTVAGDTMTR